MIIGITGTDGAGKGAVVNHMIKKHDYTHFSVRSEIVKEIELRNLPVDRKNMRLVSNDLRAQYGRSIWVDRALKLLKETNTKKIIIESIRALAEVDVLKANGGILIAVDARPEERYRRISSRKSQSDAVTYEEFLAQEKIEMNDPDPNGMQKSAVMKSADFVLMNNRSIVSLYKKIDVVLAGL